MDELIKANMSQPDTAVTDVDPKIIELADKITKSTTLEELKTNIKNAIDGGFSRSTFLIEKAKSRNLELQNQLTRESVINTQTVQETEPKTNFNSSQSEKSATEAEIQTTDIIEKTETMSSEDLSEAKKEITSSETSNEITTEIAVTDALDNENSTEESTETSETEDRPNEREFTENEKKDEDEAIFTSPSKNDEEKEVNNLTNSILDNNDTPAATKDELTDVTQKLAVENEDLKDNPEKSQTNDNKEINTITSQENSNEAIDFTYIQELPKDLSGVDLNDLVFQFNELMGELVVLAAEAKILNDDQRDKGLEIGQKAKEMWEEINKRRESVKPAEIKRESTHILKLIDAQLHKILPDEKKNSKTLSTKSQNNQLIIGEDVIKDSIDTYVASLLKEQGVGEDVPEDIKKRMKTDIEERLNNFLIGRVMESLGKEQLEEMDELIKENDQQKVWDYIKKAVPNFEEFSVGVLIDFRKHYLGI